MPKFSGATFTKKFIRKAASSCLFAAKGNREAQRGVRAMRNLMLAYYDIQRHYGTRRFGGAVR